MKLPAKFQPYRDKRGDWRWRVRAKNGKTLADSGEGYRRWEDLFRAAYLVSVALAVECLAEEPASPPRRRKPSRKAPRAAKTSEGLQGPPCP